MLVMKMNKVLVKLYVPMLEAQFDVWLPISRNISKVIILIVKALREFIGSEYNPKTMPMLYDKATAKVYDINASVKDNNIRNGTEIILI